MLVTGCQPSADKAENKVAEQPDAGQGVKPIPQDLINEATQETVEQLYLRGLRLMEEARSEEAVKVFTEVMEREPRAWNAYYSRGKEHFRLGKFNESLDDFDKTIKMHPDVSERLWERGITLYYLKRFPEAAEQFELHQNFNDQDVENSVWQFVCRAQVDGVDKAREQMLEIENDSRIPLMEIYGLFRGELTPQDVITASEKENPDPIKVNVQKFYANLYLGLYYEATDQIELAKKHIEQAVNFRVNGRAPTNNYMWDIARIHAEWLKNLENNP